MSINNFTVGKDVSLSVVTQLGAMKFGIRTNFQSKQRVHARESNAADGINRFINIPAGWEGSFNFDRANANLDNYFAQVEALYYSGQPITAATITETIKEANGSISQFLYSGVVLELADAGDKKGDDIVKMKVDFKASQRTPLI